MKEHKTEVLVVGAGPVGLMSALVLAEAGIAVEIIDREERTATRSYACALHPRTLKLLAGLGLAEPLLERGRRVPKMAFYDGDIRRAEINFADSSADFPFLLVLPQSALEDVLHHRLRQKAGLTVNWSYRFDGFEDEAGEVVAAVDKLGGTATGYIVPHWETVVLKRLPVRAQFIVGADGHNSLVRQRLGLDYERLEALQSFAAIEFSTDAEAQNEVRVVLDETSTNVLWPLPGNRYRWTFQLLRSESEFPEKERRAARFADQSTDEDIRRWMQTIAGRRAPWFSAAIKEILWFTQVAFEHRLAKRFGKDRCWLAGDAAHQTGPVGMQSMNVGLSEAAALAGRIKKILRDGGRLDELTAYDRVQQQEWRRLLGVAGGLKARAATADWTRTRSARLLSCLPGSGADLARLADQLGLDLPQSANPIGIASSSPGMRAPSNPG